MKLRILLIGILFNPLNPLLHSAFSQDECVVIIQGIRDMPNEDFFNNSSDAMLSAMAAFKPSPNITVLRPQGESSKVANPPKRSEKTYDGKSTLLKMIEEAICDAKCKNVVISFIGHGQGRDGINGAPNNPNDGGMMIGNGDQPQNNFLTASEMAAIIDRCKKSVKLIPSQCFGASMINGIVENLKNKHLVGVGVTSSEWDKKSYGVFGGLYDFIRHFLEDYYLVIGDPNVMEQIKKNAEELKKKNEEKNKEIEAANKETEKKIAECEKEFKPLEKRRNELEKQTDENNKKINDANAAIKFLNERKELEKELAAEKDKEEIKKLKAKLKTNADSLKAHGVTGLPSSTTKLDKLLEKLDKEIQKQKDIIEKAKAALAKINEEWAIVNPAYVKKQGMLEDLKNSIKAPIPAHDPVMELVIHEAFKSAKEKTKSSMPVEPVMPPHTGNVEMPKTPPTHIELKGEHFYFRKVIDIKTKKCTVVGYRADKNGNPIGPITSKACNIDCSTLEFSYQIGNDQHEVKANYNTDSKKYDFYLDDEKVAFFKPEFRKAELILPGSILAEVHFQTLFNSITDVIVNGWETSEGSFEQNCNCYKFKISKGFETHNIVLKFLEHEDVLIRIGQEHEYLLSETRNFSVVNQAGIQRGKLGLIFRNSQIMGCLQRCNTDNPVPVSGIVLSNPDQFILQSIQAPNLFTANPESNEGNFMVWQSGDESGVLYHDLTQEPIISHFTVESNPSGPAQFLWQLETKHLIQGDLAKFKSLIMVVEDDFGLLQTFPLPPNQNTWIDPIPRTGNNILYTLYAVSEDRHYSVDYHGPYFDVCGTMVCASIDGGLNIRKNNNNKDGDQLTIVHGIIPNPFSDQATLHISALNPYTGTIFIYTNNGNLIWKTELAVVEGSNWLSLDCELINKAGIYYYKWFDGIKVYTGKFQKL